MARKRTTNEKVLRSPTEKPFTTHDPTSMFEAMESAVHPTKHPKTVQFPNSPTRRRTTMGRTRSTKSVYNVNKHDISNNNNNNNNNNIAPAQVNSKLLRIREEDITEVERPQEVKEVLADLFAPVRVFFSQLFDALRTLSAL